MASFCTKCGASLAPEVQFCTACGAPTAATAAPQYAQPYVPPPTQGASGGGVVKIILIVVGVVVGLGVLGACLVGFTVWRATRGIHVESNGDKVTVQTPNGSISTDQSVTYSASDLGTDAYPGATTGKGSMKMDLPNGSMVTGIFETSDSKDQVLSFYKSKFGSSDSVIDTAETAILTMKKSDNESVMVTITANKSENEGKTQIAIVHTKEKGKS